MGNAGSIAIVDDDEQVRRATSSLIRSLGYEVELFASAEAFLCSGAAATTACIVSDIAMPGISGYDLYARMKALGRAIPFIFITGSTSRTVLAGLPPGCRLLRKPFESLRLTEALEEACGRKRPGGDAGSIE